jgi:hypothetical protein
MFATIFVATRLSSCLASSQQLLKPRLRGVKLLYNYGLWEIFLPHTNNEENVKRSRQLEMN